jgi:hypothetical protein
MRTLEENDELFQNLKKIKSNFIWRGHTLILTGESIQVDTELAYDELKESTSKSFHPFIKYINQKT